MAKELTIGQHVSYRRMSNKAVVLTGTIVKLDPPLVEIQDAQETFIETAHVDDVTVLAEEKPAPAPSLAKGESAPVETQHLPPPPGARMQITVNGKAL